MANILLFRKTECHSQGKVHMKNEKRHNPVLPHSDPLGVGSSEQETPAGDEDTDQNENYGKGPEPTLENGDRRSLMERPEAQDQKI
jgi:hypothetical protein